MKEIIFFVRKFRPKYFCGTEITLGNRKKWLPEERTSRLNIEIQSSNTKKNKNKTKSNVFLHLHKVKNLTWGDFS